MAAYRHCATMKAYSPIKARDHFVQSALVSLEVLDFALMLLGGSAASKCAEVAALAGFWINLARIDPILSRFEFANHAAPQQ
ncbi:MAG: hypothetical protein ACTHNN_11675 [Xanthobacteraceae bacterium]